MINKIFLKIRSVILSPMLGFRVDPLQPDPLKLLSNQLEPVSLELRKKLRKHPELVRHHLRLSWVSLRRFEEGNSPQKMRFLFTCRLSAQAVLKLKNFSPDLTPGKQFDTNFDSESLQALGLLGVCDHFERDYQKAFDRIYFISKLVDKFSIKDRPKFVRLIDYGAASALVLERFEDAERMLEIFPGTQRSSEGVEVLNFLNWRKSGTGS